jgi:hypothetical protein
MENKNLTLLSREPSPTPLIRQMYHTFASMMSFCLVLFKRSFVKRIDSERFAIHLSLWSGLFGPSLKLSEQVRWKIQRSLQDGNLAASIRKFRMPLHSMTCTVQVLELLVEVFLTGLRIRIRGSALSLEAGSGSSLE